MPGSEGMPWEVRVWRGSRGCVTLGPYRGLSVRLLKQACLSTHAQARTHSLPPLTSIAPMPTSTPRSGLSRLARECASAACAGSAGAAACASAGAGWHGAPGLISADEGACVHALVRARAPMRARGSHAVRVMCMQHTSSPLRGPRWRVCASLRTTARRCCECMRTGERVRLFMCPCACGLHGGGHLTPLWHVCAGCCW